MNKEKFSDTLLKVANRQEDVDILINKLLSAQADEISPAEKLALQAFCCAMMADASKNFMQIKQYIDECCEYLNKAFAVDPQSYVCHLIRILIEKNMHDATFISHIEEDTLFLSSFQAEVDAGYKQLADYAVGDINS
jgi:hypothetical protein